MKLEKINKAFPKGSVDREVAYMIATSHEYKKPNEHGAIKLVGNYKWEKKMRRGLEGGQRGHRLFLTSRLSGCYLEYRKNY